MRRVAILLALLAVVSSVPAQSLKDFLRKWDAKTAGPVVSIDSSQVYPQTNTPPGQPEPAITDYSFYHRKRMKVGTLNAIVPEQMLIFPPDQAPNPYDYLTKEDKMIAFLQTLSPDQRRTLSFRGLAPDELTGQARDLLRSIIPHPLYVQEWTREGSSISTSSDPVKLSSDVQDRVRLQIFKELTIGYNQFFDPKSGARTWTGISSASAGPNGTKIYKPSEGPKIPNQGGFSGALVDNQEKNGELNLGLPALQKKIAFRPDWKVGTLFEDIRRTCGVEIYADFRLLRYPVDVIGTEATASEMLRAMGLCFCSTYRQVGPAFVLTSDLVGRETRSLSTLGAGAMTKMQLQETIAKGRAELKSNLLDTLGFLPDDALEAGTFAQSLSKPLRFADNNPWISVTGIPDRIRVAMGNFNDPTPPAGGFAGNQNSPHYVLDPETMNKVHLGLASSYRLILPSGRPLAAESLNFTNGFSGGRPPKTPVSLPIDPAKAKAAYYAGYRTESTENAKAFCALAKSHGLKEIWLETGSPEVIATAKDAGLAVTLIVRPWKALAGESVVPDMNPLGMTGGEFNKIDRARWDSTLNQTWYFPDSIAPGSRDTGDHWARLTRLVADRRVSRVAVIDAVPTGYTGPSSDDYMQPQTTAMFVNGVEAALSLKDLVPDVYNFGCSVDWRLTGLRKFSVDLLDLDNPHRHAPYMPIPYYDEGPFGNYGYPRPSVGESEIYQAMQALEQMKKDACVKQMAGLLKRWGDAKVPLLVQQPSFDGGSGIMRSCDYEFATNVTVGVGNSGDRDQVELFTVNPINAEQSEGHLVFQLALGDPKPTCLDLSDVPVDRLSVYFNYLFKPVN